MTTPKRQLTCAKQAVAALHIAASYLREAKAPRALDKVRRALKSAQGAVRNAQCRVTRSDLHDEAAKIIADPAREAEDRTYEASARKRAEIDAAKLPKPWDEMTEEERILKAMEAGYRNRGIAEDDQAERREARSFGFPED